MKRKPKLKQKVTVRDETFVSRKYVVGDRVIGRRTPDQFIGTFVRAYCTLNNGYRNPAYVIKCDIDGKERSFQGLQLV